MPIAFEPVNACRGKLRLASAAPVQELCHRQRSSDHDLAWRSKRSLVDAVDLIADQSAVASDDRQIVAIGDGEGFSPPQRSGDDDITSCILQAKPDRCPDRLEN